MKLSQILVCLMIMLGFISTASSLSIPVPNIQANQKPDFSPQGCEGAYRDCARRCPRLLERYGRCIKACTDSKAHCEKRRDSQLTKDV